MTDREEANLAGIFPSVPQQERAQQKRLALLESGRELFIEKGYEQTTAKEIAAHAGVATGTFYRYFSDKRQLFMSLMEDQMDKLMPPEPDWLNVDPENFLASLLADHYRQLDKLGLHRVLPEILPRDSELAEVLAEARRKIHSRIHRGLIHIREKGLTWNDLDLDSVSWAVMVLVEKIPEKEADSGKKADLSEIAKIICRLVFPPGLLKN
ncbi:TetR/AcrR family transcriptional regulator [Bacillus sp. T33-2]|uniref:TetR/AcrR family transcriptional regulator n=1 Tax=Bacillus sp. T33-2 TaxID=2054168 RepID=UPI000C77B964|nr:TetR/AcrR family transcriptional regulator [Bacillus sp. T33-2]PLR98431.1 TetR/AcrR family transcriptional regulator [Bacillus sp. T33-2]